MGCLFTLQDPLGLPPGAELAFPGGHEGLHGEALAVVEGLGGVLLLVLASSARGGGEGRHHPRGELAAVRLAGHPPDHHAPAGHLLVAPSGELRGRRASSDVRVHHGRRELLLAVLGLQGVLLRRPEMAELTLHLGLQLLHLHLGHLLPLLGLHLRHRLLLHRLLGVLWLLGVLLLLLLLGVLLRWRQLLLVILRGVIVRLVLQGGIAAAALIVGPLRHGVVGPEALDVVGLGRVDPGEPVVREALEGQHVGARHGVDRGAPAADRGDVPAPVALVEPREPRGRPGLRDAPAVLPVGLLLLMLIRGLDLHLRLDQVLHALLLHVEA